jgi:hypothetical protein
MQERKIRANGTSVRSQAWVLWWNHIFVAAYTNEEAAREDLVDAQRGWAQLKGAKSGTWRVTSLDLRGDSERLTQSSLRAATRIALFRAREDYGHVDAETWTPARPGETPLVMHGANGHWMPGFQFQSPGLFREGLQPILRLFRKAGWDDESITLWMCSAQGATNGREPAAILPHDPTFVLSAVRGMDL